MPRRSDRIHTLASTSRFRVGATLVHPERLAIERDGVETALEPRVMEVLVALAERAGEVVSAEQLLIEVWRGSFYGDNPVQRAIAQLRRHLGDDPRQPTWIETIRKRGYRLIAPVAFPEDYRRHPLQISGWSGRDPYVGLSAFDASRSEVFFGRTRQTADTLAALRRQRENGRGLVLLSGASGCGKSSLLQAGVVPLLRQEGGFDGLHALTVAHCDFAHAQADELGVHLADTLSAWTLDGRAILPPQPVEVLHASLRERPDAIAEALDEAWRRRPPTQRADGFALLTIDHAEALAISTCTSAKARNDVWRIVEAVCAHPHGACLMSVRADHYPALIAALPGLAERKGSDGHVDVLAPRSGEIAQIVRMPALLAGLSFEEADDTGLRLDDVLRDAAAAQPDALPLLQHTLQALYERRDDKGMLGFAAYRAIGGLEGALAQRAEATYAALPASVQARLHAVLALVIAVSPDSTEVGGRRVLRAALPDAQAQALVDAFVAARLFVAGNDRGRPDFGVAHEAVLRQWPRARDWAHDNRRLLQARARLHRAAARWEDVGRRDDHLLASGLPLQEALDAAQRSSAALDRSERALLDASQRRQRRERRARRMAWAGLLALCAVSSAMALWAGLAQREAERRRNEALRMSDYMLADLAEKLRPLGHLALLDDVSRQALAVLGRDDPERMREGELIGRARALRTLGEVRMQQADLSSAQNAFEAAERAADAALARNPASTEGLLEAGAAAYWRGYHRFRLNDYAGAAAHWERYLARTDALLNLQPDEPRWWVERSYALNNLGTLAKAEARNAQAATYFRASATLKRRALERRPDDDDLRFDLLDTLSWISSTERARGRLDKAADGFAEEIAMLRAMTARRPTALTWERRLATALRRSAAVALERGERDRARAAFDESIVRLEALLPKAPENRVWRRDLAHALLERADLARLDGDARTDDTHLRRAAALAAGLANDQAPPAEWRRLDALIAIRLAVRDARKADEARGLEQLGQLVERAPEDVFGRTALATEWIARGHRLSAQGREDDANDDYARARTLLSGLAPQSHDPSVLAPWVEAHIAAGLTSPAEAARLRASGYRHPAFAHATARIPPAQSGTETRTSP